MPKLDQIKHAERRQEILAAALRCFIRDGFRGASISEICAEFKISPGHLYHYFENKEAILKGVGEFALQMAADRFQRIMEGPDVVAGLISEMDYSKGRIPQGALSLFLDIFAEASRNPAIAQILQEASRPVLALIAKFIQKGQTQGKIDPGLDPEQTAAVLLGVADGARLITLRDPNLDMAKSVELLKLLIARFLNGGTA